MAAGEKIAASGFVFFELWNDKELEMLRSTQHNTGERCHPERGLGPPRNYRPAIFVINSMQ
jgi:hypothetical protein